MKILKLFIFFLLFLFIFSSHINAAPCVINITSPGSIFYYTDFKPLEFDIIPNDIKNLEVEIALQKTDDPNRGTLYSSNKWIPIPNNNNPVHYKMIDDINMKDGFYVVTIGSRIAANPNASLPQCTSSANFCMYSDQKILACNVAPVIVAPVNMGIGGCDFCNFCDTNKDGKLDPATDPQPVSFNQTIYNDCANCIIKNIEPRSWTAFGCLDITPQGFVKWFFFDFGLNIIGGLAFLLMLYGVITVATSSGDPEKLNNGKGIIFSALIGLIFILFSVLLLKIIGIDIIKIPGFSL